MKIKLSDDEVARINKFLARLGALEQQVKNLKAQGDELVDVINTSWRDASQRVRLADHNLLDLDVPPMINGMGQQVVRIDVKTRTAQWETHHDAKRIAKEPDRMGGGSYQKGCHSLDRFFHDGKPMAKPESKDESEASGTMEEQLLEKVAELEQAQEVESGNYKCDKSTKEEE